MRGRWLLLPIVLIVYTALVAQIGWLLCSLILFSHDEPWRVFQSAHVFFLPWIDWETGLVVVLPAAVLTTTQTLFLLPTIRPELMASFSRRSLMLSMVAAGFVGGMLAAALFCAVAELLVLLGVYEVSMSEHEWWQRAGWWPLVLVSWVLWTPLLMFFARRKPGKRRYERVIGWLFAGTVIEVMIVTPIDIMVRRKTDCYCATGTAAALCLSVCALIWLTGPGIIIAATSKRRRWWFEHHCTTCGYAKGPSAGARCPECGSLWRAEA